MTPGNECTNYVAYVESTVYGARTPRYLLGHVAVSPVADAFALRDALFPGPANNAFRRPAARARFRLQATGLAAATRLAATARPPDCSA